MPQTTSREIKTCRALKSQLMCKFVFVVVRCLQLFCRAEGILQGSAVGLVPDSPNLIPQLWKSFSLLSPLVSYRGLTGETAALSLLLFSPFPSWGSTGRGFCVWVHFRADMCSRSGHFCVACPPSAGSCCTCWAQIRSWWNGAFPQSLSVTSLTAQPFAALEADFPFPPQRE